MRRRHERGGHARCSLPDLCDVTLDLSDTWQRSHGLQVHCHNLGLLCLLLLTQLPAENLTPAARGCTQIHHSAHP